jgi:MSHA biogenesis protein MshI
MGIFAKTKKVLGWLAISFQEDGICIAHVTRSPNAKPAVGLFAFYPSEKVDAAVLAKLAKEHHAGSYHCTTLLALGDYQFLSVDAPNVPQEELKTAIRWRLKDMLDFHVDDATIDVLAVPASKGAAMRNPSMHVVAARNQVIQTRQNLFNDAHVGLTVIDIPEMAQRNIAALLEPEGRGIAFVSFGTNGGLLTVTFAGDLYLARRIDIALSQLQDSDPDALVACYDRITLELQRSLDHVDRQYHFIAVSKLVLGPLGEAAKGLQTHLAANLYIPVETLDLESVLDIATVSELKNPEAQQRHLMTIGAALRYEEKVL